MQKKPRKTTIKSFCRPKYTGERAKNYLFSKMRWLRSYVFLDPILDKFVSGELDAGLTLSACKDRLLLSSVEAQVSKAKKDIERHLNRKPRQTNKERRQRKPEKYTITIYCNGVFGIEIGKVVVKRKKVDEKTNQVKMVEQEKELVFFESMFQRAEGVADRKLVSREDAVFAEIKNNYGEKTTITRVYRSDAFYRHFKRRDVVATKNVSKMHAPLTSRMKSKNTRSIGPWSIRG